VRQQYVLHWIKNPNPGSKFDLRLKEMKILPGDTAIQLLLQKGYEGLLMFLSGEIIGHLFYQKHEDHWAVFSFYTAPEVCGRGYATEAAKCLLRMAYKNRSVNYVILGEGGSGFVRNLHARAVANALDLQFQMVPGPRDYSVAFVRSSEETKIHGS
jgi:hypothetical protein